MKSKTINLQELIDNNLGTNTSFTHDSKLMNINTDRFLADSSGRVQKLEWELEEDALYTCAIPCVVAGGIAHRGTDEAGHIQAIGKAAGGWFFFNDQQEAEFHEEPPHWADFITPKYWQLGLDHTTARIAMHVEEEGRAWEGFRPEGLQRLKGHCSLCGRLTLDCEALTDHVLARHPELTECVQQDHHRQTNNDLCSLPCPSFGWGRDFNCTIYVKLH